VGRIILEGNNLHMLHYYSWPIHRYSWVGSSHLLWQDAYCSGQDPMIRLLKDSQLVVRGDQMSYTALE